MFFSRLYIGDSNYIVPLYANVRKFVLFFIFIYSAAKQSDTIISRYRAPQHHLFKKLSFFPSLESFVARQNK